MRTCRRVLSVVALSTALFAAACAAPMQPPADFVVLKDPGEGFRAITSDDARLRVRDLAEPTKGGLDFWVDTLAQDLGARGYERKDQGEVKNAAGRTGRWLAFAANVQGEKVANVPEEKILETLLHHCLDFQTRVEQGTAKLGEKKVDIKPPDPIGDASTAWEKIAAGKVEKIGEQIKPATLTIGRT